MALNSMQSHSALVSQTCATTASPVAAPCLKAKLPGQDPRPQAQLCTPPWKRQPARGRCTSLACSFFTPNDRTTGTWGELWAQLQGGRLVVGTLALWPLPSCNRTGNAPPPTAACGRRGEGAPRVLTIERCKAGECGEALGAGPAPPGLQGAPRQTRERGWGVRGPGPSTSLPSRRPLLRSPLQNGDDNGSCPQGCKRLGEDTAKVLFLLPFPAMPRDAAQVPAAVTCSAQPRSQSSGGRAPPRAHPALTAMGVALGAARERCLPPASLSPRPGRQLLGLLGLGYAGSRPGLRSRPHLRAPHHPAGALRASSQLGQPRGPGSACHPRLRNLGPTTPGVRHPKT